MSIDSQIPAPYVPLKQVPIVPVTNEPVCTYGRHSTMAVSARCGATLFFPHLDPGDYKGRHKKDLGEFVAFTGPIG